MGKIMVVLPDSLETEFREAYVRGKNDLSKSTVKAIRLLLETEGKKGAK